MKNRINASLLLCITVFLFVQTAVPQTTSPTTWPQFRGANGNGIAHPSQNPPIFFSPEQNVLWKTPIISGHSSPCIWGDNIFLTGFNKEKQELQVFCIDRVSGKVRWNDIVIAEKIEKVHVANNPANATPVTDGKRVYFYFGSYGFLCYDFNGKQLWTLQMPVPKTNWGFGTSPILAGNLLILHHDDQIDPHLLAVDCVNGKTVWKQPQPPSPGYYKTWIASWATPVVWEDQIIIHRFREIVAYSVNDGKRIWSVFTATHGVSTPVVGKDALFVGTWGMTGEANQRATLPIWQTLLKEHDSDGDMYISKNELTEEIELFRRPEVGTKYGFSWMFKYMDISKDGLVDETEWGKTLENIASYSKDHGLVAIKPGGEGDITSTHIVWREKNDVPEVPSPLCYQDRVYMIKNGGIASCMDAATGKLFYRKKLGVRGAYYASPIIANDKIYMASLNGKVIVFETGDNWQIIATNDLEERIYATPAIVDNKLYVRTEEHLYAFGD